MEKEIDGKLRYWTTIYIIVVGVIVMYKGPQKRKDIYMVGLIYAWVIKV